MLYYSQQKKVDGIPLSSNTKSDDTDVQRPKRRERRASELILWKVCETSPQQPVESNNQQTKNIRWLFYSTINHTFSSNFVYLLLIARRHVVAGHLCKLIFLITHSQATKSQSEMRDVATRICREYLSGAWKTISSEEIEVKRIR